MVELGDKILGNDGCLNFFAGPNDPAFSATMNFYDVHYASHHVVGTSGGNTDDMKESLGISKGSASMSVRQLEQWGAVQRVWVKGDRKDYYTANDYFGRLIRNLVQDVVGKRIAAFADLLDRADGELTGSPSGAGNHHFMRDRIHRLRSFQRKAQGVWNNPVVRLMIK